MAPLKQLESENPILDADFRDFCASHCIFSVEDFLLHDLDVLAAFAEQKKNAERLKEGIAQMLSIVESTCRPWLNGMELLEDAHRNKHVLSTGNKSVDSLLQGGLRGGQLTELVGPSASGKTQVIVSSPSNIEVNKEPWFGVLLEIMLQCICRDLDITLICMQAAASVAERHMSTVLYLDTGNSFSPRHIAGFVDLTYDTAYQDKEKCLQEVLGRISCYPVYDIFAMFDVLQHLELDLRSQMNMEEERLQLLIIDSISSLISPVLGGCGSQGHALMVSLGHLLKKLAHEYNVSVLVTNHMVAGEAGSSKPALGETWKSIPHVRLLLSRDRGTNLCTMTILKHTSIASGKAAKFVLCSN